jgi:hypothetical protein
LAAAGLVACCDDGAVLCGDVEADADAEALGVVGLPPAAPFPFGLRSAMIATTRTATPIVASTIPPARSR